MKTPRSHRGATVSQAPPSGGRWRRRNLLYVLPVLALLYVAVLLSAVRPAEGYLLISRWADNYVYWASGFPDGASVAGFPASTYDQVVTAGSRWSQPATGVNFNFIDATDFVGPLRMYVNQRSFAAAGWPNIPGQTQIGFTSSGYLHYALVYLNADWSWNTSCNNNQGARQADVLTVVLHEMGHAVSLAHDSSHPEAVMWPDYTCKQFPTLDDVIGAYVLYGV